LWLFFEYPVGDFIHFFGENVPVEGIKVLSKYQQKRKKGKIPISYVFTINPAAPDEAPQRRISN